MKKTKTIKEDCPFDGAYLSGKYVGCAYLEAIEELEAFGDGEESNDQI